MTAADVPDVRTAETLRQLPHFADEVILRWDVPGLAVAVVRSDGLVYAGGFGVRDVASGEPVTPGTVFAVGSVTKPFTALAATVLATEGILDLDRPVHEYLPEFRLDDAHATRNATTRDLLAHRTGLPRHDMVWYRADISRLELVKALRHLEMAADLREEFQYNNLMYAVAGYLEGELTGRTWEELLSERILEPLGMTHTGLGTIPDGVDDVALGYRIGDDGEPARLRFYHGGAAAPAGSMYSSATDVARWLRVLLTGGLLDGERVLPADAIDQLLVPQMAVPVLGPREMPLTVYGLGFFLQVYRGHLLAWHTGAIDGYYAAVGLLPFDDLAVVVLTNASDQRAPEVLSRWIFDRFLGLPEVNWYSVMTAQMVQVEDARAGIEVRREELRSEESEASLPIVAYAGRYRHPAYGEIAVAVTGRQLVASFHGLTGELVQVRDDLFIFEIESTQLAEDFVIDFRVEDDAVAALASPMQKGVAPIVFTRVPAPETSEAAAPASS